MAAHESALDAAGSVGAFAADLVGASVGAVVLAPTS